MLAGDKGSVCKVLAKALHVDFIVRKKYCQPSVSQDMQNPDDILSVNDLDQITNCHIAYEGL